MKFDLLDKILLGIILILVLGLIFKRCKPCAEVTPTEAIIQVVGDTAQARIYREQAEVLRKENDSLKTLKQRIKIKYETLYIESAPMPIIDSIYRANLR